MTYLREYREAYDDDSDNMRGWSAQDAQEPDTERVVDYLAHQNGALSAENTRLTAEVEYLRFDLDEAVAQRDEAWAVIARMTLDVEP